MRIGNVGIYSMLLLFLCVLEKKCGNACDKSSFGGAEPCIFCFKLLYSMCGGVRLKQPSVILTLHN